MTLISVISVLMTEIMMTLIFNLHEIYYYEINFKSFSCNTFWLNSFWQINLIFSIFNSTILSLAQLSHSLFSHFSQRNSDLLFVSSFQQIVYLAHSSTYWNSNLYFYLLILTIFCRLPLLNSSLDWRPSVFLHRFIFNSMIQNSIAL